MAANKKMLKQIEHFYSAVMEDYGEVTRQIKYDNSAKNVFKRTDYAGTLDKLKKCKISALRIDPESIMKEDPDIKLQELGNAFIKLLASFNYLCDAQIELQAYFKEKAEGKKTPLKIGRKQLRGVNDATAKMHKAMRDFDTHYADYIETEPAPDGEEDIEIGDREYKTYDEL